MNHLKPGKSEILELLKRCSNDFEKWQISKELQDAFNDIVIENTPYVFSRKFNFLQQLRLELQNHTTLFAVREDKFRYIENWITTKMKENGVLTILPPLSFTIEPKAGQTGESKKKKAVTTIYKNEKAEKVIRKVFEEMELIEKSDGACLVKHGKGTIYFAVVDAVKDNYTTLLNRKYTDDELLIAFNTTYGLKFSQLKRNGKDFEEKKKEAKSHIVKQQILIKE